ncbi:hypothetical protein WR25_08901 [Diploscapter pachys]|uniref:PLD phosphodiesterase domain-containing protein n=1 Tax=Diploscapter pachys TaxID=2018661 RepID=A0A2A2JBB5_9BILA|nr:hypothetical protein WR25_08901 [Diploscapter pachys]
MDGKQIYDQILATANRGVNFRIAQTYNQGGYAETENLMQASNGRIQVRSLDFKNWWPANLSTPATHETPTFVPQKYGNQAMYITASPPGFKACGREDDLQAMIKILDSAQEYANLAVMDYSPATLYMGDNNNKWLPEFDNAIRRAAFERQYGKIPYARVYHNKYFVTESSAYIGTSNWSPDYWMYTAGIGLVIRNDDTSQSSKLVQQLSSIFERDWNSTYTIPLSMFDDYGNWINGTSTTPRPTTTPKPSTTK